MHQAGMLMAGRDATELQSPSAPSDNAASAVSDSQIDQTWTDNSSTEDNFEVQLALDSDFTSGVQTDTLAADSTSKSWTGLDPSTQYFVRVRAVNAAGASDWSATASDTTNSEASAPNAPSGNTATAVDDSQIDESWTDNSGDEDGFEVQIALDSGFTDGLQTDTVGANVTSKSWTGLSDGTTYYTRVRAFNTSGSSSWSNTDSATTTAVAPDGAPSDNSLSATSATDAFQSWTDNSTNEDNFVVQISTTSDFSADVTEDPGVSADATSYSWTGLAEGTKHYARVKARNSGGDSDWSNTASDTTELADPGTLSWTGDGLGFVTLSWSDNSTKEQEYHIYKDGSLWQTEPENTESATTPEAGDYKVKAAHSTIPDSDFTNTVTITESDLSGGGSG